MTNPQSSINPQEAGYLLRKLSGRTFWLRYNEDDEKWYASHKIHQDELSGDSPEEVLKELVSKVFKENQS